MIGGVHTEVLKGIITGYEVYTGVYTTVGTKTWDRANFDAWGSYMATRTAADAPVASASNDGLFTTTRTNGAWPKSNTGWVTCAVALLVGLCT